MSQGVIGVTGGSRDGIGGRNWQNTSVSYYLFVDSSRVQCACIWVNSGIVTLFGYFGGHGVCGGVVGGRGDV